jgi:hypothetical protein
VIVYVKILRWIGHASLVRLFTERRTGLKI